MTSSSQFLDLSVYSFAVFRVLDNNKKVETVRKVSNTSFMHRPHFISVFFPPNLANSAIVAVQ